MDLEKLLERVKSLVERSGLEYKYNYAIDIDNNQVIMSVEQEKRRNFIQMSTAVQGEMMKFAADNLRNCSFAPMTSELFISYPQVFMDMDDDAFELWIRFN